MKNIDQYDLSGRSLELFLTVYQLNSVSLAAAQLGQNQSTVSHGLEKLRTCFGDPLFVKAGRGIAPTEFAVELVPRVRALLADLDGLVTSDRYRPANDLRPIVIASTVSELLPIFVRFRNKAVEQAPDTPVSFLELGSRDNIAPLLEAGKVELVLSAKASQRSSSLDFYEFYTDDQVCFYDPKFRGPVTSIEDYGAARHAALHFGGTRRSTIDQVLDSASLSRTVALHAPNVWVLRKLVEGTDLLITLPAHLHASVFKKLSYCPLPFDTPKLHFRMIWHKRNEQSARNLFLRNLMMSVFEEGVLVP